jgi:hypothetical protein
MVGQLNRQLDVPAPMMITLIPVFGLSPFACCAAILGSLDSSIFARSGMRQVASSIFVKDFSTARRKIKTTRRCEEERKQTSIYKNPGKHSTPAAWGSSNPGPGHPTRSR